MMSAKLPRAEHGKMNRRRALAEEFFRVTTPELIPFVSDEATWYDFDYLESTELLELIQSHYGLAIDEASLELPFWALLDFLSANRTQTDR